MNVKDLAALDVPDWPKDAVRTIRSVLDDQTASLEDRCEAAHLAGDVAVIDDDIALQLLDLVKLSSNPEELRGVATIALGPILEDCELMGLDDPNDMAIKEQTFN